MNTLALYIAHHVDDIVDEWEHFARTTGPAAAHLSATELRDHAKVVLQAVSADMQSHQNAEDQHQKSLGEAEARHPGQVQRTSRLHAQHRFQQGFTLTEMVSEYRALRASIIRRWTAQLHAADEGQLAELTRFGEAIDEGLTESIDWYSKRLEDSRNLLVGALAHDLRSPLGAVRMSADYLLRTDKLRDGELRAVGRIVSSSTRMSRYINDLLDFTQTLLGAGLPILRASLDLAVLCEEVVDEQRAAHPNARIEFDPHPPVFGQWDSARLAQLVGNLVSNAIAHGEPGEPVTVRLRGGGSVGGATIEVHNLGVPIDKGALGTLFQPLMQGRSVEDRHRGSSGLGLGLYIVREIALAHGGVVGVVSDADTGTTFTVTLPRGTAPAVRGDSPSPAAP